jgi:hypothetical protein
MGSMVQPSSTNVRGNVKPYGRALCVRNTGRLGRFMRDDKLTGRGARLGAFQLGAFCVFRPSLRLGPRWIKRLLTAGLLVVATVVGIRLGLAGPAESPVSPAAIFARYGAPPTALAAGATPPSSVEIQDRGDIAGVVPAPPVSRLASAHNASPPAAAVAIPLVPEKASSTALLSAEIPHATPPAVREEPSSAESQQESYHGQHGKWPDD